MCIYLLILKLIAKGIYQSNLAFKQMSQRHNKVIELVKVRNKQCSLRYYVRHCAGANGTAYHSY